MGGFAAGGAGASKQMNHPTIGRIPAGGRIERSLNFDFNRLAPLSLLLRQADFSTAKEISDAINRAFGHELAIARDGGRVDVQSRGHGTEESYGNPGEDREPRRSPCTTRARVVVNERTGTIVMGKDVRLGAVSILHGGFSVEISTSLHGLPAEPAIAGQDRGRARDRGAGQGQPAKRLEIGEGASIEELVGGLQKMGASARDVISILQAIKAAGALDADLEVI